MEIRGIRHRDQLLAEEGVEAEDIARWRARGELRSIRPWYVTPEAPDSLVALLRHGVRPHLH